MTIKQLCIKLKCNPHQLTRVIKVKELNVERTKLGYWFTPEQAEIVSDEIERIARMPREKQEFLKLFWNEIKDDTKRKKVVKDYATKFDINPEAASTQVNKFLFDESQRICKENKPRIEVREDGTIVHVFQSKINYT
jgi:hypothetical protein